MLGVKATLPFLDPSPPRAFPAYTLLSQEGAGCTPAPFAPCVGPGALLAKQNIKAVPTWLLVPC